MSTDSSLILTPEMPYFVDNETTKKYTSKENSQNISQLSSYV